MWSNNEIEQSVEYGSAKSKQIRKNEPFVEFFDKYAKEQVNDYVKGSCTIKMVV